MAFQWMRAHRDLVTKEQHQGTRNIHCNRKPSNRFIDLP